VCEVLSPSTASLDRVKKLAIYARDEPDSLRAPARIAFARNLVSANRSGEQWGDARVRLHARWPSTDAQRGRWKGTSPV